MKNLTITATLGFFGLTVGGCAMAPAEEFTEESALEEAALDEAVDSKDQAIFGSESCKSPKIDIFNPTDSPIRIKAVKFYDLTKGTWRSEDVSNTTIPPNGSGMRFRDNLDNAKNHRIGSWQVKYDDGGWRDADVIDGYNTKCVSNAGTRYAIELPDFVTKIIVD